ncbi:MAG: hypothetical protein AAGE52_08540 [Myxococcota bacterium]
MRGLLLFLLAGCFSSGDPELPAPLDNGPTGAAARGLCNDVGWSDGIAIDFGAETCERERRALGIAVIDPAFLARPEGLWHWSGENGWGVDCRERPCSEFREITLFVAEWKGGVYRDRRWRDIPEEPAVVRGWYSIVLEDGSEVGAEFEGTWCGGEPNYCD